MTTSQLFTCGALGALVAATHWLPTASRAEVALEQPGDVDASSWPGEQSEVSIAADPFRPYVVVAASMNLPEGPILVMSSDTAGATWRRTTIPMREGATIHADPMVAFDSQGRAFVAHIAVRDGDTPLAIEVNSSDDRGVTWSTPITISHAAGRDDKVALAVDASLQSRYRDTVYVAWKWAKGGGSYLARSTDRGLTFSRPRLVDIGTVSGLDLAVSGDGNVYLAFHDHPKRRIRVLRSTDGGHTFEGPVDVAAVRAGWYTIQPSHCTRQSLVYASLAVDLSAGPHHGRVIVAWSDYLQGFDDTVCSNACLVDSPCRTTVYVSFSDDQGQSWSTPREVPFRPPGSDRYHPWLDIDPLDGSVYVALKESGGTVDRVLTDVMLSASDDGGETFDLPIRLTSDRSNAAGSSFQYGDYQSLTAVGGSVYASWADFRAGVVGRSDIFVGRAIRR